MGHTRFYLDKDQEISITLVEGGASKGLHRWRVCRVILTHCPTGVEVSGDIPRALRGSKEMRRLQNSLIEQLLPQLRKEVAKYLRLPGR